MRNGFRAITAFSVVTAASCWTGAASGATIAVQNPGFDVFKKDGSGNVTTTFMDNQRFIQGHLGLTLDEVVYDATTGSAVSPQEVAAFSPTGWVPNNPMGFGFYGVTRYDETFNSEDPAGPTMAFNTTTLADDGSPILATLTQDLGVLAQPNTIYTLKFEVHNQSFGVVFASIIEGDLLAGSTVLDDVDSFTAPSDGNMSIYTATVTTGATVPAGNLSVRLTSGGNGDDGTTYGTGVFDNVSITSTLVPEPAALSLLGMAALGLGRRRRA